jgi:uncharacterized protein (UPF0548 family)
VAAAAGFRQRRAGLVGELQAVDMGVGCLWAGWSVGPGRACLEGSKQAMAEDGGMGQHEGLSHHGMPLPAVTSSRALLGLLSRGWGVGFVRSFVGTFSQVCCRSRTRKWVRRSY